MALTKYDKFGRSELIRDYWIVLREGMLNKAIWFILVVIMRKRSASGFAQNGTTVYYSSSAYPVSNFTLLTVNYYDEYPPGSPAVFNGASVLGSCSSEREKYKRVCLWLLWLKNIEDNGWTKSYTWYDDKAETCCHGESQNHLGGYTRDKFCISFSRCTHQYNNLS